VACVQMLKKDCGSVVVWKTRANQLTRRRQIHWPIGRNHEQTSNIPVQIHIPNDVISSPAISIGPRRPSLVENLLDLWSIECSILLELIRLTESILGGHGIVVEAW
jgi:hypothetical protein